MLTTSKYVSSWILIGRSASIDHGKVRNESKDEVKSGEGQLSDFGVRIWAQRPRTAARARYLSFIIKTLHCPKHVKDHGHIVGLITSRFNVDVEGWIEGRALKAKPTVWLEVEHIAMSLPSWIAIMASIKHFRTFEPDHEHIQWSWS